MSNGERPSAEELRERVSSFLQEQFPQPPGVAETMFSPFDARQLEQARETALRFSEVAKTAGVEGVLEEARRETETRLPSIVKYALLLFLTHDPIGAQVGAPALEERHPRAVRSMVATRAERTQDDPTSLSFFREDVYANDHHAHWHLVYIGDWRRQERQGELFLYMHQQMLARYDAERLAVGREPVPALDVAPPAIIDEGYDPHLERFGPRPDGVSLTDADAIRGRRDAFTSAIETGFFEAAYESGDFDSRFDPSGPQPALNLLASVLEAERIRDNGALVAPLPFAGLNLHNSGHGSIARLSTGLPGVMRDTSVAIRDPVFWRWHKLIDDVGAAWQEAQPARTFEASEDRPPAVTMRGDAATESPDLVLCFRNAVDIASFDDVDAGGAWATRTFGGDRWDDDFSSAEPATAELLTHMTQRPSNGSTVTYLDFVHEFAYAVRVENPAAEPADVTMRIFIVPEEWRADRRRWIEMDKALYSVPPGRSVLYRPSSLASVIRKPATRPPAPAPPEEGHTASSYCQCGWPYNLLLPRGTREGMRFRLLVMLTDAGWDRAHEERCGSMSFCGVRDARYPDRRNMGYPFDRRVGGDGLLETLGSLPNVATRTFTIRWI